ncbi:polyketide synthase dehydratase domain-containing protein, partial [Kitasatospora aburaviensis]
TEDAEPVAAFPLQWPPANAESIPVEGLYPRLADIGLDYGPLFQGVRAAWRVGDDVYTEIALPDDAVGVGSGCHPALFDAALHGGMLSKAAGSGVDLPFSWSGVRLGESRTTRARVRISPAGGTALRIDVIDETGATVVAIDSLGLRPVDASQLERSQGVGDALFRVDWVEVAAEPVGSVRVA